MARQPKSSRSGYAAKHKIKCALCGEPSNDASPMKIMGIVRWACGFCRDKHSIPHAT